MELDWGYVLCLFAIDWSQLTTCFFTCPIARYVWACVAKCLNTKFIPCNIDQCWLWLSKNLPGDREIYIVGVVAICWVMWKARNKVCFKKKCLTPK